MGRPSRSLALAFVGCLVLAGCGSRLSAEQHELAVGAVRGAGSNTGTVPADGTGAGPVVDPSAGPTATTGPAAAAPTSGPATPGASAPPDAAGCKPGSGSPDKGVTPTTLTIGNIADISGPVPGLFESAQQATKAFAAYWNATYGGVCGRELKVKTYDAATSSNGHRAATLEACDQVFATVGSISAFDDGGASAQDKCGLADFPAASVTKAHQASRVAYSAASNRSGTISSTLPKYVLDKFPEAPSKAAYLYINAGASKEQAVGNVAAYEKYGRGWKFVYVQPIDVATFNYAPFVQQMKDKGVRFVQFLGAYQQGVKLAQAMQEQNFKPDMYLLDPTAYNSDFVKLGGTAVNGTYVYTDASLFEESSSNAELQLYQQWLRRVAGNATPSYFGIFAWSAARMFVTLANRVGPDLTRKKILAEAAQLKGWTGNGINSPQNVGAKITSECFGFIQLQGSAWKRAFPSSGWACNPVVSG